MVKKLVNHLTDENVGWFWSRIHLVEKDRTVFQ